MASIHPHINFNGNAEEAFNFYKAAFGGEFSKITRFGDIAGEHFPIPDAEYEKIMLIALPIGQATLYANDIPSFMGKVDENENRSKISVLAESKDEAHGLFEALSAGGQVEMPMMDSPDGSCFAMFRDKFGIAWMIKFDPV